MSCQRGGGAGAGGAFTLVEVEAATVVVGRAGGAGDGLVTLEALVDEAGGGEGTTGAARSGVG
ncbi:MAG: hypothetical protein KC731_40190, partial [Myxococcales bacterium]|nr:hypothetical protein [Myxococcales bacterium]